MKKTSHRAAVWQPPRPSRLLLGDRSQSQRFSNAMAMKFALTNPRLERARHLVRTVTPQKLKPKAS